MTTVLITGANRGLGLGLARLYAKDGAKVFACCRNPEAAEDLSELASNGNVIVEALDVADGESVDALKASIGDEPIDILLNVAGYYGKAIVTAPGGLQEFGTTDYEEWQTILEINVMGPMRMAEAFVENVAASEQKKIVTLSSILGSIGGNTSGKIYEYRASKAAVNAIMRSMGIDLKVRGIIAVPMHPGWVRTDMGGPKADIDADASVSGMKQVIDGLSLADAGRFVTYDGGELPW
jgi:NAD(P)-dependent dehydrogenase (short-subunit alcohol dehydrogenase family)